MKKPIKELETRANRTYRGGKLIDLFLGKENPQDSFQPEDWITSFIEAKNREFIPNEGITRVEGGKLITEVVSKEDFGQDRTDPGVLIKYLDSAERLGVQVHPNDEFANRVFHSKYGKTECWHILKTREIDGVLPCVYLGFKPHVTKEIWKALFDAQDIQGMLDAMYSFEVSPGDTILVTGGTPHAIGAGCFLLEIQQPSDYTMRTEKITVAGERLTPMQIHYGIGEEKMLECFDYTPRSLEEMKEKHFLHHAGFQIGDSLVTPIITYEDTPFFGLTKVYGGVFSECYPYFITLISMKTGGKLETEGFSTDLARGDKYFIPASMKFTVKDSEVLLCYPPKK